MRSPKTLLKWIIVIAVGATIAQFVHDWDAPPAGPPRATGAAIEGRAQVVDGDSLEIGRTRIRLYGIDAPEARQDCRDGENRVSPCGMQARRALAELIGGREVSCTPVGLSHDRSVAVCTVQGRDLSDAMVRSGHAIELRQHSRGRYAAAEREARGAKRGLWAGRFDEPAQWRREHPR